MKCLKCWGSSFPAFFPSFVCHDALLDQVVAEEEVGGHDVGGVPPQVSVPTVNLKIGQFFLFAIQLNFSSPLGKYKYIMAVLYVQLCFYAIFWLLVSRIRVFWHWKISKYYWYRWLDIILFTHRKKIIFILQYYEP